MNTQTDVASQWRVGDAGHTVFGPRNGAPCPEVIAKCKKLGYAHRIVRAVNSYDAMREAMFIALEALHASKPTHAHYPEPVARHEKAIQLVSDALKLADDSQ